MHYIYHKGTDYDKSWTECLFDELNSIKNDKKIDVSIHYGTTLFFKENFYEIINKNRKNIYIMHGGITTFLSQDFNIYEEKLRLFDLIIVNENITKEYLNLRKFMNVYFLGHSFPTKTKRYDFDKENIYQNKELDFIYSGYIYHNDQKKILQLMKRYNHLYTSYTFSKRALLFNLFLIMGLKKKISLTQKDLIKFTQLSKASICTNLLYLNSKNNNFKNFFNLEKVKSLNDYDYMIKNKIAPNWKGRLFELAISKTLIIVKYDHWNLIEKDFNFVPDKHFIYFKNFRDLKLLMRDIKNNYEKYIPLIESAYIKINQFDTKSYDEKIRSLVFTLN